MTEEKQSRTLRAEPNDPPITVRVLGEFVFCPRAGLIEFEKSIDGRTEPDEGEELHLHPRLDFAPLYYYEIHALERELSMLSERLRRALRFCHVIAVVNVLAVVLTVIVVGPVALLGLMLTVCAYAFALKDYRRIAFLVRQRATAHAAMSREPDDTSQQDQAVNWWELWKAGFESIAYKDVLRDEALRMAGKPWRVLRRGSLRIPVIRKRESPGERRRLHRQDYARIGAYCQLLSTAEGADSPFGIILFAETYDGIAVSRDHPGTWRALSDGLLGVRAAVRSSQDNICPPLPSQRAACTGCRHGEPHVYRRNETEHARNGYPLPVMTSMGSDRCLYHSACGDRFRWTPPHARAIRKRLGC